MFINVLHIKLVKLQSI